MNIELKLNQTIKNPILIN